LSVSWSITLMWCRYFLPFISNSISKIPSEFILLPEAAVQCCAVWTLRGLLEGKAALNELAVIHVTEAPVSNSQEKVFPPALAVTLGLILSPLKGVMWLKILLHVAIEIVHKFKISWGMTLGAFMRGSMKLFIEKPHRHYWDHCCPLWNSLLASTVCPDWSRRAYCLLFFFCTLLVSG